MNADLLGAKLEKASLHLLRPASLGGIAAGPLDVVTFQFNPKEYTIQKGATWKRTGRPGAPETAKPEFGGATPRSMTVELFLDATDKETAQSEFERARRARGPRRAGAMYKRTAGGNGVLADVETLFSCCRPLEGTLGEGKIPSPPLVLFVWGKVSLEAFVKQVSVKYTLFKPDGTPIRATAAVTLEEIPKETARQNPTSGAIASLRSHTVVAGDSLASIAYAEYGDARLWRALAETNGIDDPMRLPTGTRLLVPSEDAATAYA